MSVCVWTEGPYRLLKSSFFLVQSMGGALLPARFWRALSLASATDMPRARPSPAGSEALSFWRHTNRDTHAQNAHYTGLWIISGHPHHFLGVIHRLVLKPIPVLDNDSLNVPSYSTSQWALTDVTYLKSILLCCSKTAHRK